MEVSVVQEIKTLKPNNVTKTEIEERQRIEEALSLNQNNGLIKKLQTVVDDYNEIIAFRYKPRVAIVFKSYLDTNDPRETVGVVLLQEENPNLIDAIADCFIFNAGDSTPEQREIQLNRACGQVYSNVLEIGFEKLIANSKQKPQLKPENNENND